jgi:hypothetical protein
MENLRIRCRSCGKELEGHPTKTVTCGCPNMATIRGGVISAVDLSNVVMLNNITDKKNKNILKTEDLIWQEERKKRKIKKLDFEVR